MLSQDPCRKIINLKNFLIKLDIKNGSNLCKLLDVLDEKLKNELIKWFIKQELNEYCVLFQESQEVIFK